MEEIENILDLGNADWTASSHLVRVVTRESKNRESRGRPTCRFL